MDNCVKYWKCNFPNSRSVCRWSVGRFFGILSITKMIDPRSDTLIGSTSRSRSLVRMSRRVERRVSSRYFSPTSFTYTSMALVAMLLPLKNENVIIITNAAIMLLIMMIMIMLIILITINNYLNVRVSLSLEAIS